MPLAVSVGAVLPDLEPFSRFWGAWGCHCRLLPSMADVGNFECHLTLLSPLLPSPSSSAAVCKRATAQPTIKWVFGRRSFDGAAFVSACYVGCLVNKMMDFGKAWRVTYREGAEVSVGEFR